MIGYKTYRINSSKVYCKLKMLYRLQSQKIVLIVAKCIVNDKK